MSSLFGNLQKPAPAPSSGGLFGSTLNVPSTQGQGQGQAQAQAPLGGTGGGGGPFGSLGNAAKPAGTGSSLFGGLNASTNQPAATSLFGTATQAQPAQQQQQQQQTSLFGSSLAPTTTTTIMPAALTAATASGNSVNAASMSASMSIEHAPNGTPYFDAILDRSRKRALGDDSLGIQLGLGDIRQRMKRIAAEDGTQDGRGHYLLAASGVNPGAAVRDLGYFTAHPATRLERETAPAGHGDADVESYLNGLQEQTTWSMINESFARSVRDFDDFVEDNMTREWQAQRRRIYEHFGIKSRDSTTSSAPTDHVAAEWKGTFGHSRRERPSTAKHGASRAGTQSALGRSSLQRSAIGAAGPVGQNTAPIFADASKDQDARLGAPTDRSHREKQARYIEKVQQLNNARLASKNYPILHEFADLASTSSESHAMHIANCYKALIEVVEEPDSLDDHNSAGYKAERRFVQAHIEANERAASKIELRKRCINGAARHLEKTFFREMETMVARNPTEGRLGGSPDKTSVVKAYVRIRDAQKDLHPDDVDLQRLGDEYVWAIIFYLLRSGHVAEAKRYVEDNSTSFSSIDRNFMTYINSYNSSATRTLPRELQQRINNEYTQRMRIAAENTIDPYKMACYKVIGRCDLQKRSIDYLKQQPDDFMWLQFRLARELSQVDARAGEMYTLPDIQKTVQDICKPYISETEGAMWNMCFYFQFLVGQYEVVVDMLYRQHTVEAIHLAIALAYYGLLRVPAPFMSESLLSHTTTEKPQINFGLMVGYYTRDFRAANVGAAVDYLCLIALNKDIPDDAGKAQEGLCHDALRELVLESREFALILGDMRADGTHVKGILEEHLPLIGAGKKRDFVRDTTLQAANIADDNGRTTDAVLLNHLAEEYNAVINIINRALGEALAVPIGQDPMRLQPLKPRAQDAATQHAKRGQQHDSLSLTAVDDPEELAQNMLRVYDSKAMFKDKIDKQTWAACVTLMGMFQVKRTVLAEQWPEALDTIQSLAILPLSADGNSAAIRTAASKFASLPSAIAMNVPTLLLWTVTCCERYREVLLNTQFGGNEGTRGQMVESLKRKTMDLATYVSLLKYRFPETVYSALARAGYD